MGENEISSSTSTSISAGYAGPEIPCEAETRLIGDMLTLIQNNVRPGHTTPDMGAITTLFSVEHPDLPTELGITRDQAGELIDGLYTRAFEESVRRGLIARPEGMAMPSIARLFCPSSGGSSGVTGFGTLPVEASPPQIVLVVDGRRVPAYVGAVPPGGTTFSYMAVPDYDYAGRTVFVSWTEAGRVIHADEHSIEMPGSASGDRAVSEMNQILDAAVRTGVGAGGTVAGPRPRIEYDIVDGRIQNVHISEFRITRDGHPVDPSVAREIEAGLEGRAVPRAAFGWEGHHVH